MVAIARRPRWAVLAGSAAALAALALTGCSASTGSGGAQTTLTFLVDNADTTVAMADQVASDFNAANPDIKVQVETRPQGGDGDNIVKTRLSTGDMSDVFAYNSGSLFQQLGPAQNLLPVTNEPYMSDVSPSFLPVVSAGKEAYGVPFSTGSAGAVLYNKKVYQKLGLSVPTTWSEFMANSRKIKDAGIDPIIQTYKTTWTSQLFVLGDFANVAAADPTFAADYTSNKAKYATTPAAIKGFEHQEEAAKAGFFNKDYASATYQQGLDKLASGEGAQYPILTGAIAALKSTHPENIADIGLFPLPGDNAAKNPLTVWLPGGAYIPKTTQHPAEAKKFQAFLASKGGCASQARGAAPNGPYLVKDCQLPTDIAPAVKDMLTYFNDPAKNSPALEFLSPVKGPSLQQITVEVGSGIRSAQDAAARYDDDVKKQAQQLNLPGWN
ncbi:ABC transporter substrate-binding protein [Arthrobacter sp. FW306-04-A]|uniref:ABC transporter substrate-binding protein n=1 Tax=Arthrobacter sp. FW306-04-A TaxID=2879619 RepID=UPI0037C136D1|nr:extracellular solute-binding protein [Arthrobacter sp. FW306-04-A]